jgi:hypothetical protein
MEILRDMSGVSVASIFFERISSMVGVCRCPDMMVYDKRKYIGK